MKKIRIVFFKPAYLAEAQSLKKHLLHLKDASIELEEGTLGVFDVYIDGKLVFSKFKEKRFPLPDEIHGLMIGP